MLSDEPCEGDAILQCKGPYLIAPLPLNRITVSTHPDENYRMTQNDSNGSHENSLRCVRGLSLLSLGNAAECSECGLN